MSERGDQHARTWDLTLVIAFLVALSAVADVAAFLRFAPAIGLPAWLGPIFVVPLKLIEWRCLTLAVRLWHTSLVGKLQSPVYVIVWALAVGLSALAAHSTIYTLLATADRNATTSAETRAHLVTALERTNGQLDAFQKPLPRPAKTVEQELGWATSVRAPPRNCARAADDAAREACRKVMDLRKELAAATEFGRLVREAEGLREKLAGLQIEAAQDPMPRAFEATIGRFVELDGKNGIAMMGMLILTLVSAFGPFALDTIRSNPCRPARPAEGQAFAASHQEGTAQVFEFPSQPGRAGQGRRAPGTARAPNNSEGKAARASGTHPEAGARRPERSREDTAGRAGAHASGQGRADHGQVAAAVAEFVGMLDKGKSARASGSTLYDAYARQRLVHGWPSLQPNVFGMHLKAAVIKIGGRKLKSGGQVYEGVALPATWSADTAAPSARAA